MGALDSACALIQCATDTIEYYLDTITIVRIAEARATSSQPRARRHPLALRRGRTSGRGLLVDVNNS